MVNVTVQTATPAVEITETVVNVTFNQTPIVVDLGVRGLTGATGPQGPAAADLSVVAGETISALRILRIDPITGKAMYASNDNAAEIYGIVGMSKESGVLDDTISVLESGFYTDVGWSWNTAGNQSLFLGANGAIVQGYSQDTAMIKVGYVITATKIFLNINEPVIT